MPRRKSRARARTPVTQVSIILIALTVVALVGLKTSAINQGLCILKLANVTPGVMELLRITHLTQMFSS